MKDYGISYEQHIALKQTRVFSMAEAKRADAINAAQTRVLSNNAKAMAYLEELTPSGSEFVGDPDACYLHVKDRLIHLSTQLKEMYKEKNKRRDNETN